MPQADQPRILILYTETGGTHANAANAIMEAIAHQSGHKLPGNAGGCVGFC
jgi:hypothetical protein